jgi:hypothetical protein
MSGLRQGHRSGTERWLPGTSWDGELQSQLLIHADGLANRRYGMVISQVRYRFPAGMDIPFP